MTRPSFEVFTHLKALYEEQWGDAEATALPESPGVVEEDLSADSAGKESVSVSEEISEETSVASWLVGDRCRFLFAWGPSGKEFPERSACVFPKSFESID